VIAGSHEHQRRLWLPVGGSPAWTERQRSWVARSVQGKVVTWLQGQEQGQGGVVPTAAMRDEVAWQRRLLGLGQGEVVNDAWLERAVNRGSLLRHAVDICRKLEAAHVSWQLDWADWQAAGGQRNTRPYRPPSPFALTPSCSCKAHHINLDTQALFGLMRTAGMLPADITSQVQECCPAQCRAEIREVVHTDGVAISVMFIRPKPARPPDKLPCMGKEEGAVNPLAHLDADWLGCDPRKTNMATVAHEERYPSGAVKSVWQRSLPAGQYYRQSGITEHAKTSKAWMAGIKPQQALERRRMQSQQDALTIQELQAEVQDLRQVAQQALNLVAVVLHANRDGEPLARNAGIQQSNRNPSLHKTHTASRPASCSHPAGSARSGRRSPSLYKQSEQHTWPSPTPESQHQQESSALTWPGSPHLNCRFANPQALHQMVGSGWIAKEAVQPQQQQEQEEDEDMASALQLWQHLKAQPRAALRAAAIAAAAAEAAAGVDSWMQADVPRAGCAAPSQLPATMCTGQASPVTTGVAGAAVGGTAAERPGRGGPGAWLGPPIAALCAHQRQQQGEGRGGLSAAEDRATPATQPYKAFRGQEGAGWAAPAPRGLAVPKALCHDFAALVGVDPDPMGPTLPAADQAAGPGARRRARGAGEGEGPGGSAGTEAWAAEARRQGGPEVPAASPGLGAGAGAAAVRAGAGAQLMASGSGPGPPYLAGAPTQARVPAALPGSGTGLPTPLSPLACIPVPSTPGSLLPDEGEEEEEAVALLLACMQATGAQGGGQGLQGEVAGTGGPSQASRHPAGYQQQRGEQQGEQQQQQQGGLEQQQRQGQQQVHAQGHGSCGEQQEQCNEREPALPSSLQHFSNMSSSRWPVPSPCPSSPASPALTWLGRREAAAPPSMCGIATPGSPHPARRLFHSLVGATCGSEAGRGEGEESGDELPELGTWGQGRGGEGGGQGGRLGAGQQGGRGVGGAAEPVTTSAPGLLAAAGGEAGAETGRRATGTAGPQGWDVSRQRAGQGPGVSAKEALLSALAASDLDDDLLLALAQAARAQRRSTRSTLAQPTDNVPSLSTHAQPPGLVSSSSRGPTPGLATAAPVGATCGLGPAPGAPQLGQAAGEAVRGQTSGATPSSQHPGQGSRYTACSSTDPRIGPSSWAQPQAPGLSSSPGYAPQPAWCMQSGTDTIATPTLWPGPYTRGADIPTQHAPRQQQGASGGETAGHIGSNPSDLSVGKAPNARQFATQQLPQEPGAQPLLGSQTAAGAAARAGLEHLAGLGADAWSVATGSSADRSCVVGSDSSVGLISECSSDAVASGPSAGSHLRLQQILTAAQGLYEQTDDTPMHQDDPRA
ncbi:hypothetical protein QJQ45_021088, partial [Haematococcus lacustris]